MSEEAFAREAEILRKLRRQQLANRVAIVVFVLGILAAAAYFIAPSDFRRSPERPTVETTSTDVFPAPPTPTAPLRAPVGVAVPTPASQPAFVDPRPVSTSPPIPPLPVPIQPGARSPRLEPEVRAPFPVPSVAANTADVASAPTHASAPAAKRALVSIKCFDQFAFEREIGGRQYFSAVCRSGTRRQVSCAGAGCRIEHDPAPSDYPR